MKEIFSAQNGMAIPVTIDLKNIIPLMYKKEVVRNGKGQVVMNNRWIYVTDEGDTFSINVPRSEYCEMVYLSKITINESISYGKVTDRLRRFMEQVSSFILFEYEGIKFRVFLKKLKNGTMDLDYVKCYWLTTHGCNLPIKGIPKRYNKVAFEGDRTGFGWAHGLVVSLRHFGFEE